LQKKSHERNIGSCECSFSIIKKKPEIYDKEYEVVSEIPSSSSAKTDLCRKRRNILGTVKYPALADQIIFAMHAMSNNKSFLRQNFTNDFKKRILCSAVKT